MMAGARSRTYFSFTNMEGNGGKETGLTRPSNGWSIDTTSSSKASPSKRSKTVKNDTTIGGSSS